MSAVFHPTGRRQVPALGPRSRLGGIMLEADIAMGSSAIFLSGVDAANSRVRGLLRASLESNPASRVLGVAPDSGTELTGLNELIDGVGFPVAVPATALIAVERSGAAT